MPMYTFRFLIPPDVLADAPVTGIGPNGAVRHPLPILECETCGALVAADKQTTHDFFHNMLDLAVKGIK